MILCKFKTILYYQCQITTAASSRHLPCQNLLHVAIAVNHRLHTRFRFYHTVDRRIHHPREHRNLGLERCPVCCRKGIEIVRQNRLPAGISCISLRLHLLRRDILTFHHTASRSSRFHRNHHQMVFQESEGHLILRTLYLLRPEVVVIIMTHQTGHTDTDRILGTRDDTVMTLRIVLKAEYQSGKHLRIHLRQLHRPYLLNHLTGRGGQTTSDHLHVHHKHIRFHLIKSRQEIDDSASLIDIRILHRLDILDHE